MVMGALYHAHLNAHNRPVAADDNTNDGAARRLTRHVQDTEPLHPQVGVAQELERQLAVGHPAQRQLRGRHGDARGQELYEHRAPEYDQASN